jgi:hypothetical protein
MINAKLQSIIDTKSAIGNAINNKGGTITTNTPFFNYAAQIDGISTGAGAYSNFVAQAQDNSKYTVYNGYDFVTNPTPNLSNNFAFNQWLLNNSATGDVVLSNVVVANGGTFNGPNVTFNEASMPFVNNTASYNGIIQSVTTNNGFIYVGGFGPSFGPANLSKYNESTLAFVGNTASYGGPIYSVTTNNGFIYVGGGTNRTVQKFYEENLAFVGNTANYGGDINTLKTNNGFIYVGGATNQRVQKFHESNLAFVGSTNNYGGQIQTVTTNNGFIYVGGWDPSTVQKFNESTLDFVGNTANYGGIIYAVTTNNGFIYASGQDNQTVQKFHESNLVFVANTNSYNGQIRALALNNGFIYAGGGFGTSNNTTVQKFQEAQSILEQLSFYNITNIKE